MEAHAAQSRPALCRARRRTGLRVYALPLDEFKLTEKLVSVGLLDVTRTDDHAAVTEAARKFFAAVLEYAE